MFVFGFIAHTYTRNTGFIAFDACAVQLSLVEEGNRHKASRHLPPSSIAAVGPGSRSNYRSQSQIGGVEGVSVV